MAPRSSEPPGRRSGVFSPWLWIGWLCIALGAIGAVLPLLPTTPFVLLAAWCFARSSKRWHDWLYASGLFGPLLRDWDERRCMPLRAKVVALVMMAGVGGSSILLAVPPGWPRWGGLALLGVGTLSVLMIRTCPPRALALAGAGVEPACACGGPDPTRRGEGE
ncbi:MAG TPA: YbaN family protein [Pseudomonadales bacterium]|nr:YbaN family protein [Pseudomonadales bacterium]